MTFRKNIPYLGGLVGVLSGAFLFHPAWKGMLVGGALVVWTGGFAGMIQFHRERGRGRWAGHFPAARLDWVALVTVYGLAATVAAALVWLGLR